jgi:hypothetical protein
MAKIISGALTTSENDSIEAKAKGVALVTEEVIDEFLGFNNEFDLNELHEIPDEYAFWVNFGVGGPA